MRTGLPVYYQFSTAFAQAACNSGVSWNRSAQSAQFLSMGSVCMLLDRGIDNRYPDNFSWRSASRFFLRYLSHDFLSRPAGRILRLILFFKPLKKFLARTEIMALQ